MAKRPGRYESKRPIKITEAFAEAISSSLMVATLEYMKLAPEDRKNGALQMLRDLDRMATSDGNVAAAWSLAVLDTAAGMIPELLDEVIAGANENNRLQGELQQAAQYLEGPIASRTKFDGEQPYVGWKGLGKALKEALDERDELRKKTGAKAAKKKPKPNLKDGSC